MSALAGALLIVGFVLLAYLPSLHGGFLWDDDDNITPPQQRSLAGLGRIWFQLGATQTYYPVLHTVFWIENRLWGVNTLGYRLANILFHSVSVGLVFLIVRRLRIPGAYLAAAIFAVHPVYVESIAWITEQKNTLSVMFYLGSLLAYLYFDDTRKRSKYALALALFVLSLASKANAVTLPPALLVILWWKRGKLSWRRDVLPLLPWFGISLAVGMFTNWYERVYVGVEGATFVLSPVQKCLLASRAVLFYLSKLFWPAKLTLIYPRWEINPTEAWQYLYPIGLAALFVAAWLAHWRWRGPWTALLLYVGTLFPLLGFFPTYIFSFTYVCDHFQYLPSVAIVVLVSAGIASSLDRLSISAQRIGQGLCALLVGTLAVLTWRQCYMYHDAITLYQATIERNPACWMAHNNLGIALANSGKLQEAIEHYQRALQLEPDYAEAHYNMGAALNALGQWQDAIECFDQALRLKPNSPKAHNNLGITLANSGQLQQAIEHFEQSLRLKPNSPEVHNNLGLALANAGRFPEAIEHYRQALLLDPDYPEANYDLANALRESGKLQAAIELYHQALQIKPGIPEFHNNLAIALLGAGQLEAGMQECRRAIELKPDYTEAYANLAVAYAGAGHAAEAIVSAQKALELARLQGQAALAQQIDSWLTTYRSQKVDPQDASLHPPSIHNSP